MRVKFFVYIYATIDYNFSGGDMEKKIKKWLSEGLIDNQTALKMLAEIQEDRAKTRRTKINITVYTVAVILIGVGVITFISANEWILKLLNTYDFLKILLMTTVTLASFFCGYKLAYINKNFPKLGNALIVLSSLLIGGTYALIGQVYHINANTSSIFFLWLLSILPAAYLFKSFAINVISIILMILGVIFFYSELAIDNELIWTVFIPVLCGITLYSAGNIPVVLKKFNDFSLSYKITGAVSIFIILLVLTCSVEESYHITSPYYIVPVILLILFNLFNYVLHKKDCNNILKAETICLLTMLFMLLMMLLLPSLYEPVFIVLANIFIIAMIIFGFNCGYKFENGRIIAVTNWMLTIYLAVNYCRWGWSFMDKSLFFILGGMCLLALGLFLEHKRKKVTGKDK